LPCLTNSDDSKSCRPSCRHIDSIRAVKFTAGPIREVKPRIAADIAIHDVANVQREAILIRARPAASRRLFSGRGDLRTPL
jgi:hypothetical protein